MDRPPIKVAIAVDAELAAWQKLNVVAFLASGIAVNHPELIGAPYEDGSGNRYLALLGHPVLCLAGDREVLRKSRRRALERGLSVGVYTEGMFATMNDVDNRAVVRAVPADDLDLVGLGVFGARNDVDRALKGLRKHP